MTTDFSKPVYFNTPSGDKLAYRKSKGSAPGVVFLGGFMSDMQGSKATFLEAECQKAGIGFLRFDYHGHGESEGEFVEGTIGRWTQNVLDMLEHHTGGKQILVGSSMGGWLMLLAARAMPEKIAALVGIAAAPDFTEALMWNEMTEEQQQALTDEGVLMLPSDYGYDPYPITRTLIEEGREHLVLDKPLAIDSPIRLLHGIQDPDVPWPHAQRIAEAVTSEDVQIHYIKDGDHRLSRDEDLALLWETVCGVRV